MLPEIAITPEVFEEIANRGREEPYSSYVLISILRDICNNMLLANYAGGKWDSFVLEYFQEESMTRKILKTIFDKMIKYNRLVSRDPVPLEIIRANWMDLIVQAHQLEPFDEILCTEDMLTILQSLAPHVPLEIFPPALNDSSRFRTYLERKTPGIKTTEKDFKEYLGSVVKHAQNICLIDPFINPYEVRYKNTIQVLAELIKQRCSKKRIKIHILTDPRNQQKIKQGGGRVPFNLYQDRVLLRDLLGHWFSGKKIELKEMVKDLKEYGLDYFQVVFCKNLLPDKDKFHDRYILTDQCGIGIGHGLDCDGTDTTWTFLDTTRFMELRTEYDPEKTKFKVPLNDDNSSYPLIQ